jgi:hypothetical protein
MKKIFPFLFAGLALYGCPKATPQRNPPAPTEIKVSTQRPDQIYFNKNIVSIIDTRGGFNCVLNLSNIKRDKNIGRDDIVKIDVWDVGGGGGESYDLNENTEEARRLFNQMVYSSPSFGKRCIDLTSRIETITGPMSNYRIPMDITVSLPN